MQTMFFDAVPRTIWASKVIVSGIETAPTKKSTAAKQAIRMLEFVANSLIFLTATITRMFRKTVNGRTASVTAIPIWW